MHTYDLPNSESQQLWNELLQRPVNQRGKGSTDRSELKYSSLKSSWNFFSNLMNNSWKFIFILFKLVFYRILSSFYSLKRWPETSQQAEDYWQKTSSFLSNKQVWKIRRLTMKWNGWYDKEKWQLWCMYAPDVPRFLC